MADGTEKMIKDVEEGDEVITFDKKTRFPHRTKVLHQYVRQTDKKMYEITTVGGRKIRATSNHPFMTDNGMVKVEDMIGKDIMIGVLMRPKPVSIAVDQSIILDEHMFANRMISHGFTLHLVETYLKALKKIRIFPLRSTDSRVWILARIAGYLMSQSHSASINLAQVQAAFDTRMDADLFEDDVEALGFQKSDIIRSFWLTSTCCIKTYKPQCRISRSCNCKVCNSSNASRDASSEP